MASADQQLRELRHAILEHELSGGGRNVEMRRQFNAALRHHRQHPMQAGGFRDGLKWLWQRMTGARTAEETPAEEAPAPEAPAEAPAETPAMKALETLRRQDFHLNLNDGINSLIGAVSISMPSIKSV